ncbi:BTB POZ domain-containing KCTD21 [Brachionus plicatilis]|uniref:BTB POZ domain-containing KCTD21 n=1 Tax=Brachionus plicatilis TaxID=10195 RepID=A0A3M7Q243_BRAPC|nr:BTB POZ domain-containing KCTD21 [Brachionus plicatilis]
MEDNDIVKFNVGGSQFLTYRSTISKKLRKIAPRTEFYRSNLFEELLNDPNTTLYENKELFFDRNPQYFDYILDFYRHIKVDNEGNIYSIEFKERLPQDDFTLNCIKKEAEFYKVDHLVELLDAQLKNEFAESLILTRTLAKRLIKLCELAKSSDWELIYRASRDGFSADDFHFKCDNVIKTLTLIQTQDNFIFGGYTEQSWSDRGVN